MIFPSPNANRKYHHGNDRTGRGINQSRNDQPQLLVWSWHVRPLGLDRENEYIIDRWAETYQTI